MNNTYVLISILIMSLVTLSLRFIPFVFLKENAEYPMLEKLQATLPTAVMGMLVVYCLKDVSFTSMSSLIPSTIAVAMASFTYLWKRNTFLSIISSTLVYMLLLQFVF